MPTGRRVVEYHGGPRARAVFILVIISTLLLAVAWPFAFYFQFILDNRSFLFCGLVAAVFLWVFFIVVMQLHFAPKVNPLLYMPLIVDILVYEASIVFGSLGSTFYGTLVILVALNAAMLALVWEELTNLAYSGVSRMWLAILPVSCFLTLASAGAFSLFVVLGLNLLSRMDIFIWIVAWLLLAIVVLLMFTSVEGRMGLPGDEWPLPRLLLWATVLYLVLGTMGLVLAGFDLNSVALVITVGLVLFSIASSDFEAITRSPVGRITAALAFTIGYVLTIICTYFAIVIILYII